MHKEQFTGKLPEHTGWLENLAARRIYATIGVFMEYPHLLGTQESQPRSFCSVPSRAAGCLITDSPDQLQLPDAAYHKVAMALYEEDLAGIIANDLRRHAERYGAIRCSHLETTAQAAARLHVISQELRARLRRGLNLDKDGALIGEHVKATAALRLFLEAIEPVVLSFLTDILQAACEVCIRLVDAYATIE